MLKDTESFFAKEKYYNVLLIYLMLTYVNITFDPWVMLIIAFPKIAEMDKLPKICLEKVTDILTSIW